MRAPTCVTCIALLSFISSPAFCAIPATFLHGVASGDPEATSIVLWTRITPHNLLQESSYTPIHSLPTYLVNWQVATDSGFSNIVKNGSYNSTIDNDYTVKAIASGLTPATSYFYNFIIPNGTVVSPTGKFRLPPAPGSTLSRLRYFIFSCSNWPVGYFNAYDLASRYDLDFWVHLGDYYYEYGISTGSGDIRWQPPPQGLQPAGDIQVLDDYRQRHALYRTDPGLQALTASAPLLAIWDDHEFMNNVYADGAQNQYPGEVEYYQRKHNALKAYTEWMPIRWNFTATPSINAYKDYAINRTLQFGDLATMFMLEDRVSARTNAGGDSNEFDPASAPDLTAAATALVGNVSVANWASNATIESGMKALRDSVNKRRTNSSDLMLGPSQLAWIEQQTNASAASKTTWQLYNEGTVMQDWFNPDPIGALQQNLAPNSAVQGYWQETLDNLTSGRAGATYKTYSTSASNQNLYGSVNNVSATVTATSRGQAALGRYRVDSDNDAWGGYLVPRYNFYKAIAGANNPTIYSGDSHNFWAGYNTLIEPTAYLTNGTDVPSGRVIATEFDGGSVTSNGQESSTTWPGDFLNAAWLAANPDMVHVEVRYRGGMYVDLSHTNQHVEYIHVNTIASQDYMGFCGAAFDVPARSNLNDEPEINMGNCTGIPAGRPYGGATILAKPFDVTETQVGKIMAGTAVPADSFLIGTA